MTDILGKQAVAILATIAQAGCPVLISPTHDGWSVECQGPHGRPIATRCADLTDALAQVTQALACELDEPVPYRLPSVPPPQGEAL